MKHAQTKRLTILGVLVVALLALIGLAAMAVMLHKKDMQRQWSAENIITLKGETACLPHKNNDQPHTLECAAGLKVNNSYFALKYDNNQQQAVKGKLKVIGIYSVPADNDRYDTAGTIKVKTVEKQ
jgi:hypothetical protein